MMPVPVRCLEAARRRVRRLHGLETYEQIICNGWASLWIYQYPHIREVIESLPDAPQTVYDHWVLGKLFGYSEEASVVSSGIWDQGTREKYESFGTTSVLLWYQRSCSPGDRAFAFALAATGDT